MSKTLEIGVVGALCVFTAMIGLMGLTAADHSDDHRHRVSALVSSISAGENSLRAVQPGETFAKTYGDQLLVAKDGDAVVGCYKNSNGIDTSWFPIELNLSANGTMQTEQRFGWWGGEIVRGIQKMNGDQGQELAKSCNAIS